MDFKYTIIYVNDVKQTIHFYEKAFKQKCKMLHESGQYAELETGGTTLAFASNALAHINNLSIVPNTPGKKAPGFEIAFTSNDVKDDYMYACKNGAKSISRPTLKPWGQEVAYVEDINGIIIEIGSRMR